MSLSQALNQFAQNLGRYPPKGCLMVREEKRYIDSIGLSYVDGY